jgi:hypothetical protein
MPSTPSDNDILDELARRVDQRIPPHPDVDDQVFGHLRLMLDEAAQHAHMGTELPELTRARPLKKALVDGLRPVTSYQRIFNARVLEVLETLTTLAQRAAVEAAARPPVEPQLDRMHAAVATIDVGIDELSERVRTLDARLADDERAAAGTGSVDPLDRGDGLQTLLDRVQMLEAAVARLRDARADGDGEAG